MNTLPNCAFRLQYDEQHKPGILQVTAVQAKGEPFMLRVCVDCFDDTIESMRADGFTAIKITAPEQPILKAWRG